MAVQHGCQDPSSMARSDVVLGGSGCGYLIHPSKQTVYGEGMKTTNSV